MLSLTTLRKLDPNLANLPDEQLEKIRNNLYEQVELIFNIHKLENIKIKTLEIVRMQDQIAQNILAGMGIRFSLITNI